MALNVIFNNCDYREENGDQKEGKNENEEIIIH